MQNSMEQRKRFLINFAYFAVILGIAICITRWVIPKMVVFVIAFIVAVLLKPLVRLLHAKLRIPYGIAAPVVVGTFYIALLALLTWGGFGVVHALRDIIDDLPALYAKYIQPPMMNVVAWGQGLLSQLDPNAAQTVAGALQDAVTALGSRVTQLSGSVLGATGKIAASLPGLLVNVIICVVFTAFLSIDYTKVWQFLYAQLSEKTRALVIAVKDETKSTLVFYLRSYFLIFFITFLELCLGLGVVGIKYFWLFAFVIAFFDILPIIGSGLFLIPWGIISLFMGNIGQGLGILAVYVGITIIRNIIEPKIVGQQVGLHPLVTLATMVAGTIIFGPLGLLGLPVTLAIITRLNNKGIIHAFNKVEPEKQEEAPHDSARTKARGKKKK